MGIWNEYIQYNNYFKYTTLVSLCDTKYVLLRDHKTLTLTEIYQKNKQKGRR